MASLQLLPSFSWPPPPPPNSSSGRGRGGGGDGGDSGNWKPNVVAAVAGAHLGRALRRRLAGLLLRSPEVRHLDVLPRVGDIWFEGSQSFATHAILGALGNVFSAPYVCGFALFNGKGSDEEYIRREKMLYRMPRGTDPKRRLWTNILLAVNVLAYVAQIATEGKLLTWGAKVNHLIDKGEVWRLATSSLLHANLAHLAFNCFSLNSIGPTVELLTGPRRFLTVYFTSALAGSLMSYFCCELPAVGASGAIFGLVHRFYLLFMIQIFLLIWNHIAPVSFKEPQVGSYTVYMWRHRRFFWNGRESLEHIARVVFLNMAMGLFSRGIDNWGHLGGLLGGVASAWCLGPAWQHQYIAKDGRMVFKDNAPVFQLMNRKR